MKLPSLKLIIAAAIGLFVLHGVEEYATGFPTTDKSFLWIVNLFQGANHEQSLFIMYQIGLMTVLTVTYAVVFFRIPKLVLLVLLGLILILESSHILVALMINRYYPGLYTSLLFPVLSVLYWLRLAADLRRSGRIKTE